MAERMMLSPITRTVTVAPLTMSGVLTASPPLAAARTSVPRKWSMMARIFASGIPTSTIGSWCSISFAPRILPLGSRATRIRIGLPEYPVESTTSEFR
jgi:hypothetical protein